MRELEMKELPAKEKLMVYCNYCAGDTKVMSKEKTCKELTCFAFASTMLSLFVPFLGWLVFPLCLVCTALFFIAFLVCKFLEYEIRLICADCGRCYLVKRKDYIRYKKGKN